MRSLRELLDPLPLPPAPGGVADAYDLPAAHLLGGELPEGHVSVWSGPSGPAKTSFLLGLLLHEVRRGRPTLLATYDLPAPTLALRLLALEAGVPVADLDGATPGPSAALAAARARVRLSALPLYLLEARGLTVASLEDRCVRSPRRIDLLGVDYVEAVVRPEGEPLDTVYRDLAALAQRRWVAVLASAKTSPAERLLPGRRAVADRVGSIEPAVDPGAWDARLLANRHGPTRACRLRLDPGSTRWIEAEDGPPA